MNQPVPEGVTPPVTGLDKEEPELVNEEDIPRDENSQQVVDTEVAPAPVRQK